MPGPVDQHADFEPLREGLRRASAVAGFALRMARENAPVPPGIVSDFMEARSTIEREFVRVHDKLSPDLRKRLKELVLKTKGLTPEVMAKGAEPLAERLRGVLEPEFADVWVEGEISNLSTPASGHCYFTLKDENASIDAVVWKSSWPRLLFKPEEGLEVIATGRLTTFPRSSKYQIVIEQLEPAGAGALMMLLEERRKK
ncbi:partial Exodeoxyribonuclease 7 large subunit, partial [uncultured bacterium]